METKPIDDGGPAFPFKCQGPTTGPETYYGMSLRDHFAGLAMQAEVSIHGMEGNDPESVCLMAYEYADAMLKARKRGQP